MIDTTQENVIALHSVACEFAEHDAIEILERALEKAKRGELHRVAVAGFSDKGDSWIVSSNMRDWQDQAKLFGLLHYQIKHIMG